LQVEAGTIRGYDSLNPTGAYDAAARARVRKEALTQQFAPLYDYAIGLMKEEGFAGPDGIYLDKVLDAIAEGKATEEGGEEEKPAGGGGLLAAMLGARGGASADDAKTTYGTFLARLGDAMRDFAGGTGAELPTADKAKVSARIKRVDGMVKDAQRKLDQAVKAQVRAEDQRREEVRNRTRAAARR